ncbi:Tn3 family transposase [Escherichia coli]|nr:Tn3 family transposase [Escherichia coli]EFO0573348.1 Tn3 family transposase [Escherichia coli]
MPVDFLTTEQTESYGRFTGEPDELQLARYFHLDEADKEFIGKSRGDHNRLGIALQIGCVRFLGTFLTDMNHIPSGVRHFTARQLGIRDITVLAEYGQRENTRREHAALIRQHYQYREFAWPWTFRLTRLLYTRSWISNERPGLLFDLATGWLMQHRIILPGATTLTRLISEVREKATLRLWNKLALIPSAEQRSQLEMLLGPTDCSRLSLLESLKKGPVTISGPAFNEAIERWKTLNDFGLHAENLSTLPAVRLKNLARYAGMTSVFNIARMSPQKRMAVLVAFVLAWETLTLDDALDVLDAMLAVIIRDARKIGQKKRLRSLKDLDKSALALASACSYLLKEETPDESIRAEVFSYIPRQKLAEIITLVREIARPSDDNFHEVFVATEQGEAMNLVNAKYGNTPGLKAYSHVSDQYAPFATQVIPATASEAPYILDGLLMNDAGRHIREQFTDTGGFTDHVFAACAILGYRFAPRIRDLPSKRLYAFNPSAAPAHLRALIGGKVNQAMIERNWPDILRIAATIAAGTVAPSQILRKLASYPRQNELATALREVGRVERTLFMIDWILDAELQRRAQIGLNKGEAHHALKRAISFHRRGEIRDRSAEGQHYRIAGMNLLAAIIIFWNTMKLGEVVANQKRDGKLLSPDLLAHVSPLGWEHINLTGEYRWPKP